MERDADVPATARKASATQVAKAVFWSFLGIRRSQHHDQDAVRLKPIQVIVAGILGVALFVFVLVVIVRLVTR